jgi:hypothetical protein
MGEILICRGVSWSDDQPFIAKLTVTGKLNENVITVEVDNNICVPQIDTQRRFSYSLKFEISPGSCAA